MLHHSLTRNAICLTAFAIIILGLINVAVATDAPTCLYAGNQYGHNAVICATAKITASGKSNNTMRCDNGKWAMQSDSQNQCAICNFAGQIYSEGAILIVAN